MRALLRRQLWQPLANHPPFRPLLRYQHDLPHKEYFQNPGQTPLPDATPYTPPAPPPPPPPPTFPSPPSYFRRTLRSISWAALFGTLGIVGGISLLTWDYLQPPFESGSEEDQELLEEIQAVFNVHPLVQGLRDDRWTETSYDQSQSRMLQSLSGTQGLIMKGFQHPSANYTILAFYTGSGIEGWPDVIHGGLITTLFDEAAQLHSKVGPDWLPPYQVVVDFKEPLRPGEIYAILLPPPGWEEWTDQETGEARVTATVLGLLMRMESRPEIVTEIDEVAKTQTDTVNIPTRGVNDSVCAQATFYFYASPFNENGTRMLPEHSSQQFGGQAEKEP